MPLDREVAGVREFVDEAPDPAFPEVQEPVAAFAAEKMNMGFLSTEEIPFGAPIGGCETEGFGVRPVLQVMQGAVYGREIDRERQPLVNLRRGKRHLGL